MGQTIGTKLAFLPPHVSYMPHSFRFIEKSNRKDDSPGIPFRFFKYSEFQDLNDTYTIIFSHGNAHDLGMCLTYTESIAKALECNLIAYDYTGYGLNYGTPNEENCVEDLHDVFEYLLSIGVKKEKIILMGHSIGGGVTLSFIRKYLYNKEIDRYENFDMPYEEDDDVIDFSEEVNLELNEHNTKFNVSQNDNHIAAIILLSTFTNAYDVVSSHITAVCPCLFPNVDNIKYAECPILIFHGIDDEIINYKQACILFDSVNQRYKYGLWLLNDCSHNSIVTNEKMIKSINAFLHCK